MKIKDDNKSDVGKNQKSDTIKTYPMSNVFTGGKRNETTLSDEQVKKAEEAARKQGYDGDISYSENSSTSFHGSVETGKEGKFHYLVIGTDAYPIEGHVGKANDMISLDGCMAHEVVGHYQAWLKGTTQTVEVLEEAQASIRASKVGVDLTDQEREILYQDAIDRLQNANIDLKDVQDILDIWEQ